MKRLALIALLTCSFFLGACSRLADSEVSTDSTGTTSTGTATIKVRELLKTVSPEVKILAVIQNSGTSDADNLQCTVKPRRDDAILEEQLVTFDSTLNAGEETWFEVVLSSVVSHSEYDDIVFQFTWEESKTGSVTVSRVVK